MEDEKTVIELEPADAAFVLRGDGSPEMYLEEQAEDAEVSEANYLIAGLSIAFVHHREALRAFVDRIFAERAVEDGADQGRER